MADRVRRVMAWVAPDLPGYELVLSATWRDGCPPDHYYVRVEPRRRIGHARHNGRRVKCYAH